MGGITCMYYGTLPSNPSANCPTQSPASDETIVVNPRGYKTTYRFDGQSRTVAVVDHNGGETGFTYDADNNRTCVTDPLGNMTGFGYDGNRNLTELIDSNNTDAQCQLAGVRWRYEYNPATNDLIKSTDPLGHVTEYIYDANGNLTRIGQRDYIAVTSDSDEDGYSDADEAYWGTDSSTDCSADFTKNNESPDAWPPDFTDDRVVNSADSITMGPWVQPVGGALWTRADPIRLEPHR